MGARTGVLESCEGRAKKLEPRKAKAGGDHHCREPTSQVTQEEEKQVGWCLENSLPVEGGNWDLILGYQTNFHLISFLTLFVFLLIFPSHFAKQGFSFVSGAAILLCRIQRLSSSFAFLHVSEWVNAFIHKFCKYFDYLFLARHCTGHYQYSHERHR